MSYYLKKFWRQNLLVILAQIVMYGLAAGSSLIRMQVVQSIIAWDFRQFLYWSLVTFSVMSLNSVVAAVEAILRARATRAMNGQVRRDMAATLLERSHQEYHAQDTGEYLSWFTTGVDQIDGNGWYSFFGITSYMAQIVCSVVALASVHWSLVLASLLMAVVMVTGPKLYEKKMEQMSEVCAQGQAAGVSGIKDMLRGYDALRFFDRSSRFSQGISQANDKMERPFYQRSCMSAIFYGGLGIANITCQILVNCLVAFLSIQGVIIQSALSGCGTLCGNVANGVTQLGFQRMCLVNSRPYFARITVHDSGKEPERPQGPEPVEKSISVEHVDFGYGEKKVLEDLTLTFRKGKKYALTGPSGCGKSTLLKLILGWLPNSRGAIRFDGKDARDYTPEQLQQQMSYIAQDVYLFNTTIRDNITVGEDFTDAQLEKALRDSALAGDLKNMPLGLDTPVGEEGASLSGGQRQRVAIARALIHNRSILLVDEGTSALDQKNASIVEESLLANPELTLLLVSHHLSPERRRQFDGVYRLEPVAAGSSEQL